MVKYLRVEIKKSIRLSDGSVQDLFSDNSGHRLTTPAAGTGEQILLEIWLLSMNIEIVLHTAAYGLSRIGKFLTYLFLYVASSFAY